MSAFLKRFRQMCFPVNFANFLRTPILNNLFRRLLLRKENKRKKLLKGADANCPNN